MAGGKWTTALLLVALGLAVSGCGTKQTLDQAINCDQFKRMPDGTWSTIQDVSLDYEQNGVQVQVNVDKGLTIDGKKSADIVAALNKKCEGKK